MATSFLAKASKSPDHGIDYFLQLQLQFEAFKHGKAAARFSCIQVRKNSCWLESSESLKENKRSLVKSTIIVLWILCMYSTILERWTCSALNIFLLYSRISWIINNMLHIITYIDNRIWKPKQTENNRFMIHNIICGS